MYLAKVDVIYRSDLLTSASSIAFQVFPQNKGSRIAKPGIAGIVKRLGHLATPNDGDYLK